MMMEFHQPGDVVADILFNWLPVLGAGLAGLFGLVLILRGYRHYLNSAFLRRSGQPAKARVTEKWLKKGHVDREERHRTTPIRHYFLRYEILNDPRTFSVKEVAPINLWKQVEVGDTVDVIAHPRRNLMRLAAWQTYRGKEAGAVQMTMGAVALAAAITVFIMGAFEALSPPERKTAGADWLPDQAEVLQIGRPADPFLRMFAPGSRLIRVVFGDTQGGAWMANQRVIRVTPDQIETFAIAQGTILPAWLDPANEYNAVLDLERRDR